MELHEILRAVAEELPNSFTEDFKAQLRTMDTSQFEILYDVITRAWDTRALEQHYQANPHAYLTGPQPSVTHSVSRGAW